MVYLASDLILFIIWIFLLLRRPDLKREILIASTLATPFSLFDFLARPYYWNPVVLFDLPVGMETILFNFLIGGIAASLYEQIYVSRLIRQKLSNRSFRGVRYALLSLLIFSVLLFAFAFRKHTLYLGFMGMISGILMIVAFRRDLIPNIIFSGILFGLLYLVVISLWFALFPVAFSWVNIEGLSGILILGVPLEQFLFALLYGSFWGPMYEFLLGYKLEKV